jgi:hypothetical protein
MRMTEVTAGRFQVESRWTPSSQHSSSEAILCGEEQYLDAQYLQKMTIDQSRLHAAKKKRASDACPFLLRRSVFTDLPLL